MMSEIDYHKNMIIALEDEVNMLRKHIVDTSLTEHSDASILLPIVYTLLARCAEKRDMSLFVDGVINSMDDTGIDLNTTISALQRMGVDVDPEWFRNEYEVTVMVPVSVTLMVEAPDMDYAEEEAKELLDNEGLDRFKMDYDINYDSEIVNIVKQ
jgi:hypothetical protein